MRLRGGSQWGGVHGRFVWWVAGFLIAGFLAGCGGDSRALSPAEEGKLVREIDAAVLAIPHVVQDYPVYNRGGLLEPSRLHMGMKVDSAENVESVIAEVTRIAWTSRLAPMDHLSFGIHLVSSTEVTQREVSFTDKAVAKDLTRRYGPRPDPVEG